jgi:hypothetical protein
MTLNQREKDNIQELKGLGIKNEAGFKLDEADLTNLAIMYKQANQEKHRRNLEKSKRASKFWGSGAGVAAKLPSAMKDTILNLFKKKTSNSASRKTTA